MSVFSLNDFSLYATKRHEEYREIYKKLLEADGAITRFFGGLQTSPTFEDANRNDFQRYLESQIPNEGQRNLLLSRWDADWRNGIREAHNYIIELDKQRAEGLYVEAKNALLLGAIYLSVEVENVAWDWMKMLSRLLGVIRFGHLDDERLSKLDRDSDSRREKLKELIQQELAGAGEYPPTTPSGADEGP